MKIVISFLFLFCVFIINTVAQEKTILLVRHAEKVDDSQDPELSPQGKERVQRLVKAIGKYKPGGFFSTDFKRTRDTLAPLAAKREKKIEIYDPRKPQELIDTIMKSKTKRFVISGHSNTIPGIANLLLKKEVFKNLNDSEHSVIWLVRLNDGKVTRLQLLDY